MKQRRHKREESFSILLISNVGQGNRQFHVSRLLVRLVLVLFLVFFGVMAWLVWLAVSGSSGTQETDGLQARISEQEQQIGQLEEEIETLKSEKQLLASENDELRRQAGGETAGTEDDAAAGEEAGTEAAEDGAGEETDPAFPSRYPCSGSGIMTATYSEDKPYISIAIREEGNVVAAGDGTVTRVGSDDTYPLIIEVDHGNGYQTRYLCREEAEVKSAEGNSVHTGDTLLTILTNDTQLDYQVIYEGAEIDPLSVIDAKG